MNPSSNEWLWSLLRTNLLLVVAAAVIFTVLAITRLRSPALHRAAWMVVLLQGLWYFPFSIELPWLAPNTPEVVGLGSNTQAPAIDLLAMEGASVAGATQTVGSGSHPTKERVFPSLGLVLVFLWGLGLVVSVVRNAWLYGQMLHAIRSARLAKQEWQRQWRALQRDRGLTSSIPLKVHTSLGPMLCRTPSGYEVVIPEGMWTTLSASQRESVLRHELAHYKRGDVWSIVCV